MELGETEAFGILDNDNGGVGDVDTDFDNGGSDQDINTPLPEAVKYFLAFLGGSFSMN